MGNRADLKAVMPAMLDHDGWWEGSYRDFDLDGKLLDERQVKTHCEFPDTGEWHYLQHNWISWADGREALFEFGGKIEGERMIWKTDRFSGYGWQTHEHTIMLKLDRLDVPGACYVEMINLVPGADTRARTWQWMKDDAPWKRTLCDEKRITAL
ncbi:hypothetical protein ACRAQ7_02445 [Erythrobacter sp. W53]|uniref:hypothetical protein n=1 Tax=Erythrobacter sp. W53 TaxID=3425947 RepID=UPI003D766AF2